MKGLLGIASETSVCFRALALPFTSLFCYLCMLSSHSASLFCPSYPLYLHFTSIRLSMTHDTEHTSHSRMDVFIFIHTHRHIGSINNFVYSWLINIQYQNVIIVILIKIFYFFTAKDEKVISSRTASQKSNQNVSLRKAGGVSLYLIL